MTAEIKAKDINREIKHVITVNAEDEYYDIEFIKLLDNITKMVNALKDCCEMYHFEINF